ncbi:MAG: hypothetical protein CMM32_01340 [Rhodospirillaceae bacterium]|nr:hypothetical protein [Rhodospirillaceae bacterium]|tara:strand:+ start:2333 stop:2704 length:372 start_codon:yes stop_codon:yes gene_type:complete
MKNLLFLLLIFLQFTNSAIASHMDKELFLEITKTGDSRKQKFLGIYLRGLLHGLESANISLLKNEGRELYCNPHTAALSTAWLEENLLDYIVKYPTIPNSISIGILSYYVLTEKFPCPKTADF